MCGDEKDYLDFLQLISRKINRWPINTEESWIVDEWVVGLRNIGNKLI